MERTFSPMVRQFSAIAGLQQAYTLVYSLDPDGETGCRLTLCRTGSSQRMELKNLLRELYRMPGQQWQRTEQQCQQLYHSWGIRIPDINCSYLTSAVGVVYGTSQKLAIRKEILQAVSEQYGVSVSAVDSGIRRMNDQLEAKPAEGWTQFKAESGFEAEKPTTGKLIYAIKRYLIQQKSRE